jgi:hypothetical protein
MVGVTLLAARSASRVFAAHRLGRITLPSGIMGSPEDAVWGAGSDKSSSACPRLENANLHGFAPRCTKKARSSELFSHQAQMSELVHRVVLTGCFQGSFATEVLFVIITDV